MHGAVSRKKFEFEFGLFKHVWCYVLVLAFHTLLGNFLRHIFVFHGYSGSLGAGPASRAFVLVVLGLTGTGVRI